MCIQLSVCLPACYQLVGFLPVTIVVLYDDDDDDDVYSACIQLVVSHDHV